MAGIFTMTLAACGGGDDGGGGDRRAAGGGETDCADYEQYGDLKGKTVSVYTGIVDARGPAAHRLLQAVRGVHRRHDRSTRVDKAFETQILVRAQGGNPPDIAYVPQPGLLAQLVATGAVVAAPRRGRRERRRVLGRGLEGLRHGRRQVLRRPAGRQREVPRLVLPDGVQGRRLRGPDDLDEMRTLSDKIVADGKKPWCAGIGTGEATGWPVTDWLEDMMLRRRSRGLRPVGRPRDPVQRPESPRRSTRSAST